MSGYWELYHDELKAMLKENLGLYELKVYLALADITRGYKKKKDRVAISQIAEMIGIPNANVARALRTLKDKGLVTSDRISPRRTLRGVVINTVWQDGQDDKQKKGSVRRDINNLSVEIQSTLSPAVSTETDSLLSPETLKVSAQTVTNKFSNKQKTNKGSNSFPSFWSLVPKHKRTGKIGCLALWESLGLDSIANAVLGSYAAWCESDAWTEDNGKWAPKPLKWLTDQAWESMPAEPEQYLDAPGMSVELLESALKLADPGEGRQAVVDLIREHQPEAEADLMARWPEEVSP